MARTDALAAALRLLNDECIYAGSATEALQAAAGDGSTTTPAWVHFFDHTVTRLVDAAEAVEVAFNQMGADDGARTQKQ